MTFSPRTTSRLSTTWAGFWQVSTRGRRDERSPRRAESVDAGRRGHRPRDRGGDVGFEPATAGFEDAGHARRDDGGLGVERLQRGRSGGGRPAGPEERNTKGSSVP